MIQLQKTTTAPASLANKKRYDGDDVKDLLAKDHYDKCYICERQRTTDFQIEHLHLMKDTIGKIFSLLAVIATLKNHLILMVL